ncbi:restriction endonuclease [Erysipelothrix sp. HDW6C]|uniref:restriction endonuclease n=1 Tax=Erysipelothrix sp. HDW6C TaxID=2714930 RepID=UPI001408EEBA|nr:restriction endonuclease [Erysipelothrix sp. HDW6C]QIK70273.1 restriction endonuclease [Erysipelothrix sp. HDW6C]
MANYERELIHDGLNKYRVVKGKSRNEVNLKCDAIQAQWDEQWLRKKEVEKQRSKKEKSRKLIEDKTEIAKNKTAEAEMIIEKSQSLLHSKDKLFFKWNNLYDNTEFEEEDPFLPPRVKKNKLKLVNIPRKPVSTDEVFNAKMSIFTKLSKKKANDHAKRNQDRFAEALSQWTIAKNEADKINNRMEEEENSRIAKIQDSNKAKYKKELKEWKDRKRQFESIINEQHKGIDIFIQKHKEADRDTVVDFVLETLDLINYPISFKHKYDVEFDPESGICVVDYYFPVIEDMPTLKSVTYIKSRDDFKQTMISKTALNTLYDDVVYQIVLLVFERIFGSESYGKIKSIVLNGRVNTIDKTTGKRIEPCILSVKVNRSEFNNLDLKNIDAKAWFKSAKGVSATKIALITPVAPVMTISKNDSRFIDSYSVTSEMNEESNLAAMDWQDFENLIREVFEQEFNANGGEVKITQSSRDGGVDAIAFDPDPIRGGKIVIQAKRYTNVVGVANVRDLYGTVMNEGATKGILVTTANYGNDSYDFAKDKPITLLNGANLLHMLEKHGHKARIDISEAKEIMREKI